MQKYSMYFANEFFTQINKEMETMMLLNKNKSMSQLTFANAQFQMQFERNGLAWGDGFAVRVSEAEKKCLHPVAFHRLSHTFLRRHFILPVFKSPFEWN